jgi:hypothetical protein
MRYKRTVLGMSDQFFYVHLKFTPKSVSLAAPIGSPHEIVVHHANVFSTHFFELFGMASHPS